MNLGANVFRHTMCGLLLVVTMRSPAGGEEFFLHSFRRQQLTDTYYSEGATAGDIDGDGSVDVVHGPYWFAGPTFRMKREIYAAKPQPRHAYADSFCQWI